MTTQGPLDAIPNNLPPLLGCVVARKDLIEQISVALASNPVVSLTQSLESGYGKTMGAILYAMDRAVEYPGGCFFIPARPSRVVGLLAELAQHLGFSRQLKDGEKAAQVRVRLKSGISKSLLILDDVPDEATWDALGLQDILENGATRVLITTRAGRIAGFPNIPVGPLNFEEAAILLNSYRGDEADVIPQNELESLVHHMDGRAVALTAAGIVLQNGRFVQEIARSRFSGILRTLMVPCLRWNVAFLITRRCCLQAAHQSNG